MCRGEDCFVSFLHVREKLYLDFSNATTKYKVDRETNPITFFSFFFHSLFFTRLTQNHLYTYHIFLNNFQVSKKFKRPCITVQLWNSRVNYILLRAQTNNTSCRINSIQTRKVERNWKKVDSDNTETYNLCKASVHGTT